MTQDRSEGSRTQQQGISGFLVKALVALVVIVVGVAAGVYTGSALTMSKGPTPETLSNRTFLEVGETFPNYELWDTGAGTSVQVAELVRQGPALLVFVSHHCSACTMMMNRWKKVLMPELRSDIQVVLVYDETEAVSEGASVAADELPGARACTTDRQSQTAEDGITATPTVIALDRDSKIKFIMTGYDRNVDAAFINDQI